LKDIDKIEKSPTMESPLKYGAMPHIKDRDMDDDEEVEEEVVEVLSER